MGEYEKFWPNTFLLALALARYENLFAHTVAVSRLQLSKKNNPLLIFTL